MTKNNSNHKRALAVVQKYFPQVEEVEDGTKPIEVEVTAKDSKSAAVRNHQGCAMAVACKRLTKADGVIVSISTAYIIKGKTATRYRVPAAVQREIISFDREAGFAEGSYNIRPMEPTSKLGHEKPTGPHKVTGKPRRTFHYT